MKLSIITINYNNREGLQKTIDSVICQTWRDFEWIIIDGGSTDGSRELIEQYQAHFAYWCSEPDKGVYNAMNKGIVKAQGEYLNFMNSGDCFASSTILEKLFSASYQSDVFYGYMMRKSLNGHPNNARNMHPNIKWYDFYYDTLPHQSSFIRRTLFDSIGLYDESYKQLADWKWFATAVVWHQISCEFVPLKISIYECGGISDSGIEFELSRLRSEVFPISVVSDFHSIMLVDRIRKNSILFSSYKILRWIKRIILN